MAVGAHMSGTCVRGGRVSNVLEEVCLAGNLKELCVVQAGSSLVPLVQHYQHLDSFDQTLLGLHLLQLRAYCCTRVYS